MQTLDLGKLAGVRIRVRPSTFPSLFGLWIALVLLVRKGLKWSWRDALWGGAAMLFIHVEGEFVHQMGHVFAAKRTGYPMKGITFFGVLSSCVYPKDEPQLPATIHIKRALGGPALSFIWAMLYGLTVKILPHGKWRTLAQFGFWENLLIFTLQMFVPLGFNDGSTLLYWLKHKD